MLRDRVVTAVILIGALLAALFLLPPLGWTLFAALVLGLAGWEWGGLARCDKAMRAAFAVFLTAAGLAAAVAIGLSRGATGALELYAAYAAVVAFWLIGAPLWLRSLPQHAPTIALLALGALILLPTYLALVQLRNMHPLTLLACMMTVWIADIAAYFSGRRFGRSKMAPSISPGKTWAGAYGAFIATALYALAWFALAPQHLPARIREAPGALLWTLAFVALLTLAAIVGDLFESALKRQAGVKDSGNLLPGHGGVLDRIDALLPVLPLAALVSML